MNKKKLVVPVLLASMMLSACGVTKTSMDIKYNVDDYVTLPKDYKKMAVTVSGDYEYTDEKLSSYYNQIIASAPYMKDDSKTEVAQDSIVNVDYVGKKDGKAFEGGTQKGAFIDVAGNKDATTNSGYIEGFTSGLVGAKVGSTVDSKVTFPENYQEKTLAGQEVTFTFTVNYVCKEATIDTIDDTYTKDNLKIDSVAEFKKLAEKQLKSSLESTKKSDVRTALIQKMTKKAKVKYPSNLVSVRMKEFKTRFRSEYKIEKDQSLEEYVKKNLNMSYKGRSHFWNTIKRRYIIPFQHSVYLNIYLVSGCEGT
jgi:trigger factor